MKKTFLCLIALLLWGYNIYAQSRSFTWNDFESKEALTGSFWRSSPNLADPTDLYFKNGYLIVLDETNPRKFIKVIDVKTKKGFWTGSEGFGPGEIMSTQLIDKGFSDETFWLYDLETYKFHEFSLHGKSSTANETLALKEDLPLNTLWLNNSNLLLMDWSTGKHIFKILDYKTKKSYVIGNWSEKIEVDDRVPLTAQVQSHHGVLYGNESRSLFALGALIVDYLLIYDDDESSFISLYGPDGHQLRYYKERPIAQRGFTGYMNLKVVGDKIYALYSGKYDKDLENHSDAYDCKTILVFDRKGNPLRKISLNESIQCFDIDSKSNILYGLNFDKENPRIIEFQIN